MYMDGVKEHTDESLVCFWHAINKVALSKRWDELCFEEALSSKSGLRHADEERHL